MITASLHSKVLGQHEQVVIRDLIIKKVPDAKRLGQHRPTTFMPAVVRSRIPTDSLRKLHRNGKKAIMTARAIANICHDRMYVLHFEGENFLCTRSQKDHFVKLVGVNNVSVHTVKPKWEDKL